VAHGDERFDVSMVDGVDRILITHEHADHVSIDLVRRAALERSNDAEVETTPSLKAILAMPFIAPWGSLLGWVDRTRLVKPKYVIPIHDAFLSDGGATFVYVPAATGFTDDDIELVHIPDFESVTLTGGRAGCERICGR
jgi:L-ascorbate metabolism protein UlaG (beta-lactamase superfamily)